MEVSKKKQRKLSCHEKVEEVIGNIFEKFGHFISRHPIKIIIFILLLNGSLGVGMLKMEEDIDVSRVYTPMNSHATKDEKKILDLFPDRSGDFFHGYQMTMQRQYLTVIVKPIVENVLNTTFLSTLNGLKNAILAITANYNEQTVNFSSICAKNLNACVIDGAVFMTAEFSEGVRNKNITFPMFTLATNTPVNIELLLGGVNVVGPYLTEATHLKLQFNLRSDTAEWVDKAHAWQAKVVDTLKEYYNANFEIAYAHTESLATEMNSNISGDIALFSVTIALMVTFACLSTFSASNDCVGNRMFLGLCGVIAAGLSIVASFGIVSACGMSYVSIVGNVPFLILGIGVDDMFILLAGLMSAGLTGTISSRIGKVMRASGVAVTITSLTNVLAFASGATSTFKSVRNFCVYTGVAVIFCYINQVTFFVACMVLNENRVNKDKHFIVCCKTTGSVKSLKSTNASRGTIFCCAGEKPDSRQNVESHFDRFLRWILPKFVSALPQKLFILILFAGYLGVAIWGVVNLEQGLIETNLVSETSYYYKFKTWETTYFSKQIPIAFVIDRPVDYSNRDVRTSIENVIKMATTDKFMSNTTISWLEGFSRINNLTMLNKTSFISNLHTLFQTDPAFRRFEHDVRFSQDNKSIVASRMYVFTKDIKESQDSGKMMLRMREIADSANDLSVIAFSPPFIFYEQYVSILPQTLQTLGTSIIAVFAVTIIFMPHPFILFYILVTLVMIITGTIGFMHFWGLTLSSVTMIHLIMSVGFSVDMTAHVCHSFMISDGGSKNERVTSALEGSGGPLFNGAVSSIIGICMLSTARSYIFKSFFKVMLLVILFGLGHSVLFLPVILSFLGPGGNKEKKKTMVKPFNPNSSTSNGSVDTASDTARRNLGMRRLSSKTHSTNRSSVINDILEDIPGSTVLYNGNDIKVIMPHGRRAHTDSRKF